MDHEKAQFNVEEATEGVFSFDHSDENQEVSISSVEKETKANKKKASKRDIIVVDDKEVLARNSEMEGVWVCARGILLLVIFIINFIKNLLHELSHFK